MMEAKDKGPPKPKGWCTQQGIEHLWKMGMGGMAPTPNAPGPMPGPMSMRECVNCGQRQQQRPPTPPVWEDVEESK